jgi:hypothetical protein
VQSLFLFRVESTSVWLNENKKTTKKQKAKHDPGICRSKVYVYYDVIIGFKIMILGLRLTLPPSYAIGHYFEVFMKK